MLSEYAFVTMQSCDYCGEHVSIVEVPAVHPGIDSDELPETIYECRAGHLWASSDAAPVSGHQRRKR